MNSSKHLDITEVIVTDMHFVPDPDDEEVKGWREGCDEVGVRAHHLE